MSEGLPITPDIHDYAEIVAGEILNHFKIKPSSWKDRLIRFVLQEPARRFAGVATRFDRLVATYGLQQATTSIRNYFIPQLRIIGGELIPPEGPVLVVANHPGGADSIALVTAIPRPDIHVIVGERVILRALANASRHLIFVDRQGSSRVEGLRRAIAILRERQMMILFPRGILEPDPSFMPGAMESIRSWSNSIGIFLKKVPETCLVPAVISGTVCPRLWHSPFTHLCTSIKSRLQLCMILQAALQQVLPGYLPNCVTVRFGSPLRATELSPSLDVDEITHAAIEYTARLLDHYTPQITATL